MPQRSSLTLILLCVFLSSCTEYFKDDFRLDIPAETRIKINFPSLVEFEIIQTVTPDRQGLINEVANTFVIANELDQPIQQLKFGINIFDSEDRFQKNLVVSYVDSIQQTLTGFGKTRENIFNTSFDSTLTEDMIDIFILKQDVLDTHPFSGIYVGEAFSYSGAKTTPTIIPYVKGAIDYKGDVLFRASGSQVEEYNISGRISTSGQFIGKSTSLAEDTLTNKADTIVLRQNTRLTMTLVPGKQTSPPLDSIVLVLNRN